MRKLSPEEFWIAAVWLAIVVALFLSEPVA